MRKTYNVCNYNRRTKIAVSILVLLLVLGGCKKKDLSQEQKEVYVGVRGEELFTDIMHKTSIGEVSFGTKVEVLEIEDKNVRISVPSIGTGWMFRCHLCSASELRRRKVEGNIPKWTACLSRKYGKEIEHNVYFYGTMPLYLGVLSFEPGLGMWFDETWEEDAKYFGCDLSRRSNVLYYIKSRDGDPGVIVELNILPTDYNIPP